MSKKEVKTNAMRMLDRAKVSYTYEEYECDDFTDGIQTADKLGYDHKLVYKTLVTTGKTGNHYVFVIPIEAEIDFKASDSPARASAFRTSLRRKAWNADQACTVRPSKGCKSRICRCDPSITRCGDGVQSTEYRRKVCIFMQ